MWELFCRDRPLLHHPSQEALHPPPTHSKTIFSEKHAIYILQKYTALSLSTSHARIITGTDAYRGTSPIKNAPPLGPYSRPIPRVLGGSWGGGRFLMSEVPL